MQLKVYLEKATDPTQLTPLSQAADIRLAWDGRFLVSVKGYESEVPFDLFQRTVCKFQRQQGQANVCLEAKKQRAIEQSSWLAYLGYRLATASLPPTRRASF